jgi:SnoaL-like polyketide cyclase
MRGTNTGSMMGLPPTGKSVVLNGADFIRVEDGRIRSVDGYFDSRAVPDQLGLQVVVQPNAVGPFTFGVANRVAGNSRAKPGAFSITALRARDAADVEGVSERSRRIAAGMPSLKGFIGLVATTIGERMLTISAWEHPDDPRQLIRNGEHPEAMKKFFGPELGGGGYTAVFVPERINAMWVRCPDCQKMIDHAAKQGVCGCGATLPEPMAYW